VEQGDGRFELPATLGLNTASAVNFRNIAITLKTHFAAQSVKWTGFDN